MISRIFIVISIMLMFFEVKAQTSSILKKSESNLYVKKAIKAQDNNTDSMNSLYYTENLRAYNQLKEKGVFAVKFYYLRLYRKIEHYSFADSFDRYFYWDKEQPCIVFVKEKNGRNVAFAETHPNKPGSKKLDPIMYSIFSPEWDFFLNWEERNKAFLTLGFNGVWFVVLDNCMYVLNGSNMEKASDFFRREPEKYTPEKIMKLFLVFNKTLYSPPKMK